jgi:formate hydrogenlyase transcriptional activator
LESLDFVSSRHVVDRHQSSTGRLPVSASPGIEQPNQRLQMLSRIMARLAAVREPGEIAEVLAAITQGLVEHADVAVASIWLYTTDEGCPVCRTASPASPSGDRLMLHTCARAGTDDAAVVQRQHRVPIGYGIIGRAAGARAPLLVNNLRAITAQYLADRSSVPFLPQGGGEPDADIRWSLEQGFEAAAAWPLIVAGDELVGAVAVLARRPIDDEEFHHLGVFAQQAAISIKSARLFDEIERLKNRLVVENAYLQEEIRREGGFEEIVGDSAAIRALLHTVRQVAPTDSTVLLFGETGTGKELVARAIHRLSPRRERALIKVNCGAISPSLVESELFGHERGAFTGALQRRLGRFELADGGTLFMDEVGELPPDVQVKLLRVLQEQEFERVGGDRPIRVDVRVIAATNRHLEAEVAAGRFRSDLFYRLNVFPARVPPLRERPEDIPRLAHHFVAHNRRKLGKPLDGVSREGMDRLMGYAWPGNVRELQNVLERACVLATSPVVQIHDALGDNASRTRDASSRDASGIATLEEMERVHIQRALAASGGRVHGPRGAAVVLGINPNTLRSRMEKLGISKRG